MFKRLKAAVIWAKLINCYNRQDYNGAAEFACQYRAIANNNNAAFRALDATLDIFNHKSDVAREKFQGLAYYLSEISGDDSAYIKLYAEYYICLIEKNVDCEEIRQAALSISANSQIKKWLRLPNTEVPI